MKEYMDNRELSWLKFNDRVLKQANDTNVPLAERLTFISIYQTNLDEFFRVRMGFLYDQMLFYPAMREGKSDMTSEEQLKACFRKVRVLNKKKDHYYKKVMSDIKAATGFEIIPVKDVTHKSDRKALDDFFDNRILPLLSPQKISKRTPFPFLNNGELYIIAQLESKKGKRKMGTVSIANAQDERLIPLPGQPGHFVLAEDLILSKLPELFRKDKVVKSSLVRCTRSADIEEDDYTLEEHADYRTLMENMIRQRRKLHPMRLEYTPGLEDLELDMLAHFLDIDKRQMFVSESPFDFSFVFTIQKMLKYQYPQLFYKPLVPKNSPMVANTTPMIRQIQKHDIFLAYPFESMAPFLRLLDEAAVDPNVRSIKMTLYRVASNSRVVRSLIRAADNGKEVVALVELRARFDEQNNIGWSKELEAAGVHVIYGLSGLKVHSKLCLITVKNDEGISYVTQIGTGNYNEKTAQLYTDMCLMSADQDIGEEANVVFSQLLQGETVTHTDHLFVAPNCMITKICERIDKQIEIAKAGGKGYCAFKCNAITSKQMILKLIEASQAGVEIDLVVRGICCLIPGVRGYTDNIRVRSIVGRYLEHSRIYIFGERDKDPEVYISSADLMTRNLVRRVEVAAPILDAGIKATILRMYECMLEDNVKASQLGPDKAYKRVKNKKPHMNSQEHFFEKKI